MISLTPYNQKYAKQSEASPSRANDSSEQCAYTSISSTPVVAMTAKPTTALPIRPVEDVMQESRMSGTRNARNVKVKVSYQRAPILGQAVLRLLRRTGSKTAQRPARVRIKARDLKERRGDCEMKGQGARKPKSRLRVLDRDPWRQGVAALSLW